MIDLEDAIHEINNNIAFDGAKMITEGECVILLRELQAYRDTGLTSAEVTALAQKSKAGEYFNPIARPSKIYSIIPRLR